MSKAKGASLIFDGVSHSIALIDASGKVLGTWPAYNNVDSHATLRALPNAGYSVEDRLKPHHHAADPNGPYGSYGIIRFHVQGHPGIGLHSGRANAKHMPGAQHATMGCIRTTDLAMQKISGMMRTMHLTTVQVKHNNVGVAHHSSIRNAHIGHVSHVHHHGGGTLHHAHSTGNRHSVSRKP